VDYLKVAWLNSLDARRGARRRRQEDLKRQMKTWKAVRELHIQGAGLQSAVASPNGSARRLAVPPPPSASKERSRKQKLPTSSSPMGPSPHEAQPAAAKPAAAKLAPNKLAPKRSPPKQNNKPAPKQLAPRPPAWAAVAPLAVPAAPQQQCPQHQCNRPSIGASDAFVIHRENNLMVPVRCVLWAVFFETVGLSWGRLQPRSAKRSSCRTSTHSGWSRACTRASSLSPTRPGSPPSSTVRPRKAFSSIGL
jgi:hypothetical protein